MAAHRPVPVTAFTVRPAEVGDGPALYSAWQNLRKHNAEVDRRVIPSPVSESDFVLDLREMLGRTRSAAFVAEVPAALAGFIAGTIERNLPDRLPDEPPEEQATVVYLWVEERFRRLGIGRELFGHIDDWARRQEGVAHFEMAVLTAD